MVIYALSGERVRLPCRVSFIRKSLRRHNYNRNCTKYEENSIAFVLSNRHHSKIELVLISKQFHWLILTLSGVVLVRITAKLSVECSLIV